MFCCVLALPPAVGEREARAGSDLITMHLHTPGREGAVIVILAIFLGYVCLAGDGRQALSAAILHTVHKRHFRRRVCMIPILLNVKKSILDVDIGK